MPNLLESFGYDSRWRAIFEATPGEWVPGRVVGERRGQFDVVTARGRGTACLAPRLRRSMAQGPALKPAVGDFVGLLPDSDNSWRIDGVLPRRTVIARREAGRVVREQVLAANVDTALIVCAFGGEINARRIERLVSIVLAGGARAVLVGNKADLVTQHDAIARLGAIEPLEVERHCLSLQTGLGFAALQPLLVPGATVALVGSSGVGKTSLLNAFMQGATFATGAVAADGKGRHTTRSRHLELSSTGVLLLDTPGIREVGMWQATEGIDEAFPEVARYATRCRFNDCQHHREPGCAVQTGVDSGELAEMRVAAWRRLRDEAAGRVTARPTRHGRGKKRS